jgi:hypothetical protein
MGLQVGSSIKRDENKNTSHRKRGARGVGGERS